MNNKKTILVTTSLALCLIGLSVGQANAFNGISRDWRDQYPDVCPTLTTASQACTLCHMDGSNDLNPYGDDVKAASYDFLSIEGTDSDGDGRTNGQEINLDCTLPGDASSVPADEVQWGQIKALFR
jgi:hypothetical protein